MAALLQGRLGIGNRLGGIRQQAQGYKGNGQHAHQAHPDGGLAIAQGGFDAVFHADLAKGNRTGGIVNPIGAALQQGRGVLLPLVQLHKLHHSLVAGNLNVLAQHQVGNPHQGIEPVQCQRKEGDDLHPVVAFFQVGALVGKNLRAGGRAHAAGNVNLRLEEAQHKSGFNLVGFITAPYFDSPLDLLLQPQIGKQTDCHNQCGNASPYNPYQLRGDGRQPDGSGL